MKNKTASPLRTWFNNIPIKDTVDRRMASMLQVILIGFITIIALSSVLNMVIPPHTIPLLVNLIRSSIAIIIVGIPLTMLRRGYFRSSTLFIIAIFFLLETFAVISTPDLRSLAETLSFFTVAIILAGLLISRLTLLVTFVLSAAVLLFSTFNQANTAIQTENIIVSVNFILLNGLMSLFIDRFGVALRAALNSSLERENELRNEINSRRQVEAEREKLITQLEANNAELERFTYTVSHELKSPIVTMKGFLGSIDKDLNNGKYERAQKDLARVSTATSKMHETLTDLLELSKVGRIINPPEEIDLATLIQESLDTVHGRLNSCNVKVNVATELPTLYGDHVRLREVLENLISNAVKYMGDQHAPVIEIGTRLEDNERIIFVKDNGLGIDPQYHTRIFGLFDKLNAASEGTGIGLALVKRIIEVHGGRVWVESEGLSKGSTFCFTIPDERK